ncbi:MAG: low molecular weight phosphotyrosine protein phosphatase [Propionibacteriales bacterium]|nr:low molecular weight phosphotyrosine protein phosphatase [Propionibacteriales bacterium]
MPLPPPSDPAGPYRIAVVCLGNICRSPIAQVVLTKALGEAELDGRVEVYSAGTGDWHIGQPMDLRAASTLAAAGYDGSHHRAQRFTRSWHDDHDLILAMDHSNFRDLQSMAPPSEQIEGGRLRMFREFDPEADETDLEVPDPYYDGDDGDDGFDLVLAIVERTAANLADRIVQELADPKPPATA